MPELKIVERALHHNVRLVRRVAGDAEVVGVVKGNGYGLGLLEFAGHLVDYGVRRLAVSELSEALELKKYGIQADIMLLTPVYDSGELELAIQADLILCIDSRPCAQAAERAARRLERTGRGQLCVDTGFGRYGFSWDQAGEVCEAARELEQIRIVGTYSHLSRAGARDGSYTQTQYQRFLSLCGALEQAGIDPGFRHLADSYGLLRHPELRLDGVRVGSAFLGRLPFPDQWGFERIGTLSAPVKEIRTLGAGSTVGYGGEYVTERTTRIAVIGAGYSHGFGLGREKSAACTGGLRGVLRMLRTPRQNEPVLAAAGERRFPVLGPVGMCATVLDVTGSDLQVGDWVELPVNPLFVNSDVPRCYI